MSRKYQLNEDNVLELLDATNIVAEDSHPEDPLTKSRIRVTLNQLKPYDNNPRTARNPKFDEILISIENAGLDQPPNVSRRSPKDSHYMIIDGGNTRLEILNLLHAKYRQLAEAAESDEERLAHSQKAESFFVIDCIFKPWERESKALAGHMSENENRGGMLFIEKALAVQKQRQNYDKEDRETARQEGREYNDKPLSIRALAQRITTDGWTIHHSHITRYDYAANTLLKGITDAFWAGAGAPLVRELRKYDNAYTRYWQESEAGQTDPTQIETQFIEALREADGESFYMKGFLRSMNERLAKLLDSDPNAVSIEVGAIVNGTIDRSQSGDTVDDGQPLSPMSLSDRVNQLSSALTARPSAPASPDQASPPSSSSGSQATAGKRNRASGTNETNRPSRRSPATSQASAVTTEDSATMADVELVALIMERVRPLAERHGLDLFEITEEYVENGSYPFFVKPANRVFQPGCDDDAAAAWWALTKYSFSAELNRDKQFVDFEKTLLKQFGLYIKQYGLAGTLIHIEECVLGSQSPSLFEELNAIKRLCALYVHRVIGAKGQQ